MSARTSLSRWAALVAVSLAFAATLAAAPAVPRVFDSRSFTAIREAHAGRAFLVVFWSVSCEPCAEEMMIVAELHRQFPEVPIALVAADAPAQAPAVLRFLSRHSLGKIETWQFGNESMERLRYSVDRTWTGELPRTYVFEATHASTAKSGIVDETWLRAWMEKAQAAGRK